MPAPASVERRTKARIDRNSPPKKMRTGPDDLVAEDLGHAVGERADRRGHREREDPGGHHVAGDSPADGGDALGRSRAHHAAGDHLGRRERIPEVARGEDHGRAGALRRESLGGVHLDDAGAHRPDDPPAAHVGAERDGGGGRDDHPGRRVGAVVETAVGDQRERDDAHRLLSVVRAMGEREHAARDDLPELEARGSRAPAAAVRRRGNRRRSPVRRR